MFPWLVLEEGCIICTISFLIFLWHLFSILVGQPFQILRLFFYFTWSSLFNITWSSNSNLTFLYLFSLILSSLTNLTWSSKRQLCQSLPCFRSSSSCRQQRTSLADNKNLRPHFIFHFMLDHISSSSCPQQRTFSAGNGNTFQATLPSIVYFNI